MTNLTQRGTSDSSIQTTQRQNGQGDQQQQTPSERYLTPRATVLDTPEAVVLELEMPGVSRDAIDVRLDHDDLTVTGVRRLDDYTNVEIIHQERPQHNYRRSFVLSERIDGSRIQAKFENGVLRLALPKSEDAKPKKIEIS